MISLLNTLTNNSDWLNAPDVPVYFSASGSVGVVTVAAGAANRYTKGMRVKITQSTTKYFLIIGITNTTVTLFGGTDYTLSDEAVTTAEISTAKCPAGFPSEKSKWTVATSISTMRQRSGGPTTNTWYASGNEFTVPAGDWHLQWWAAVSAYSNTASGFKSPYVFGTLSTTSANESWPDMTGFARTAAMNSTTGTDRVNVAGSIYREKFVSFETAQTLYANYKCNNIATGDNDIIRFTDSGAMVLSYTSVYF